MSKTCPNTAFPATLTSGLGLLHVWGRRRVPSPAMGITTVSFLSMRLPCK